MKIKELQDETCKLKIYAKYANIFAEIGDINSAVCQLKLAKKCLNEIEEQGIIL